MFFRQWRKQPQHDREWKLRSPGTLLPFHHCFRPRVDHLSYRWDEEVVEMGAGRRACRGHFLDHLEDHLEDHLWGHL